MGGVRRETGREEGSWMGTEKGGKKRADRFLLLLLTKQRERGNYKETEPGKMHNNVLIWAQGQGEVSKKGLMKENGKMRSVCGWCRGYSGNPSIGLSPVTQRQPLSDPTAKTTVNSAAVHNAQSSQRSHTF